jgi:hypothetical protein
MIGLITIFATYLQLMNDSAVYLYVKVFGSDGSLLTETSIAPQQTNIYSDQYAPPGNPLQSQSPYAVHWYCQEGGVDYSICTDVSDGALVTAETCFGTRQCPQKKVPKEGETPPNFNYGLKYPPSFPPEETKQD